MLEHPATHSSPFGTTRSYLGQKLFERFGTEVFPTACPAKWSDTLPEENGNSQLLLPERPMVCTKISLWEKHATKTIEGRLEYA